MEGLPHSPPESVGLSRDASSETPSVPEPLGPPMIVGACRIRLYLPGVSSLKEKRSILKPLLNQLRRKFSVAAAEVEHQDVWQTSDIALVTVANDSGHVYAVLENAVHWIETDYVRVELTDWELELR